MDIWISIHNVQMANNIVKWWKTKFLNGYKQFSVDCGESKVSDTEELLGRLGSECDQNDRLRTTCTTPPLQSTRTPTPSDLSTPKQQIPQHHLNFEEFSCDVAVENDNQQQNQEKRQEFSFTLYDFDGHGKITKDDIAGLVTTIYEVLGSSVKVPHYGSKTIQVKLTVSPDQSLSATIVNQKDNNHNDNKNQENRIRYKKDLNVTIKQGIKHRFCKRHVKRNKTTRKCCNKHDDEQQQQAEQDLFLSDDSSDICSRISENVTSDDDDDDNNNNNNNHDNNDDERIKLRKTHKKCHKNNSGYTIPNLFIKEQKLYNNNELCTKTTKKKKRSGSLQRQELLEIIQANMDKNNLSFQTPRKHSNYTSPDGKPSSIEQHKHKPQKLQQSSFQYLANIGDPTHFYVDLAALQNTTQLPQTQCQYDKLIDAVMCVSNKKLNKPQKYRNKAKLPFQYQPILQYTIDENKNKLNKKLPKETNNNINNINNNNDVKYQKMPHIVTGHTSSPHHLRHRNRQEDQARAMQQVMRWLEQEFSNDLNIDDKPEKTTNKDKTATATTTTTSSTTTTTNGIERHEHHHVHEHIHHHYHHYQDTPPLVV